MSDIFIKQDDYVLLNAPYMEAYIKSDLFAPAEESDKGTVMAARFGDAFHLIGVFNVRIFNNPDQDREKVPIKTFCYPNMIETFPSENIEMKLNLNDSDDDEDTKYLVLKYYRGDRIMPARIKKDSLNCEKYVNMMCNGKIPNTIAYKDLSKLWLKNFEINGIDLEVPVVTVESMVATLCRDAKNPRNPYRLTAGKKEDYDQNGYIAVNTRQVTSYTNVMSALTFEDMGAMLTASLNMSKDDDAQIESPFEDILRM